MEVRFVPLISPGVKFANLIAVEDPAAARGAQKHEIYAVAFGGHLFYDLFSQGKGDHGPLATPPPDPLLHSAFKSYFKSL